LSKSCSEYYKIQWCSFFAYNCNKIFTMKTIRYLNLVSSIFLLVLYSCSMSEEEPGVESVISIFLDSDVTTIELGSTAYFGVKTNLMSNITSNSVIYVNDAPITGKNFTPSSVGSYKIRAEYKNLKSNELTLTVVPAVATSVVLSSSIANFDLGSTVSFTIRTNLMDIVTPNSVIYVNDVPITGENFTPSSVGSYKVRAEYKNLKSNELILTVVASLVSVEVTSDVTTTEAGNLVRFTSKATFNDGKVIDSTEDCIFYVNGSAIDGNIVFLTHIGDNKIKASVNLVVSPEINVQVTSIPLPLNFTKKAIIEDYTGAWCGWCTRVIKAIELVKEQSEKILSVGVHINDSMKNEFSNALKSSFDVNSLPTAYLNRDVRWNTPEPHYISQATNYAQGTASLGLSINSFLSDDDNLHVVVRTGFSNAAVGTKLVVFILEDGIVENQANYTSYYNGVNPLVNFEHDNVLRWSLTNVLGDVIDASAGLRLISYRIDLKGKKITDTSKVKILAMFVDSNGKKVLNAQWSNINENKSFD